MAALVAVSAGIAQARPSQQEAQEFCSYRVQAGIIDAGDQAYCESHYIAERDGSLDTPVGDFLDDNNDFLNEGARLHDGQSYGPGDPRKPAVAVNHYTYEEGNKLSDNSCQYGSYYGYVKGKGYGYHCR